MLLYFYHMKFLKAIFSVLIFGSAQLVSVVTHAQPTPYELQGKNYTATYAECIDYYHDLDRNYRQLKMIEMGETDAGIPLHLVLLSDDADFNPGHWDADGKVVILINNGIHPGEPDGIDASMMLARDLLEKNAIPDHVVLAIIPIYNIGGALMRGPHRPDQNGPPEAGSRGNSQNLDLNRDFIKCDSKEARSFAEIFHYVKPQIFMDNHVSDGADYQHVMTLATTQHNKLGGVMGEYLDKQMEPEMFRMMGEKKYDMLPYCNVWGHDAKEGWTQFFDSPRYSSGYVTLFQAFGFVPETHMLKSYSRRVDATYTLMQCMIDYAEKYFSEIRTIIKKAKDEVQEQKIFPLQWKVDSSQPKKILLKGYVYEDKNSDVSGLPVKFYNRDKPIDEYVNFYDHFVPSISVTAPEAYILPRGWWKVAELLKLNEVMMYPLPVGRKISTEKYRITSWQSSAVPFENHHLNNKVETEIINRDYISSEGDWYIPVAQDAKRFIIETLEPRGGDSYFAWNFFDPILVQKEGYSDYAYEAVAAEWLRQHPEVKKELEQMKKNDEVFAADAAKQLEFIYKRTPFSEPRHNIYPVMRVSDQQGIQADVLPHIPDPRPSNKHDE